MKFYLDCLPCLLKQSLDYSRRFSNDEKLHKKILKQVLIWAKDMDMSKPAPIMGKKIYDKLYAITKIKDPYKQDKKQQNDYALKLLPEFKKILNKSKDRLKIATKLAIAGNIIDMGVIANVNLKITKESLKKSLTQNLKGDFLDFKRNIKKSKKILYIADNAGEIVFDKLLIEEIGPEKIILAVRSGPVLNDALKEDAKYIGLNKIVKIIETGTAYAGIVLKKSSKEFIKNFNEADMVIAKGQGNYETLSDCKRKLFLLFKAKCEVIAKDAQVKLNDLVIKKTK